MFLPLLTETQFSRSGGGSSMRMMIIQASPFLLNYFPFVLELAAFRTTSVLLFSQEGDSLFSSPNEKNQVHLFPQRITVASYSGRMKIFFIRLKTCRGMLRFYLFLPPWCQIHRTQYMSLRDCLE